MEKEYISIKEFAAAVGVSQQAIYKQLNNKLQPYLKVIDKKKMLDKSAISMFLKKDDSNDIQQQLLNMLQQELKEKNQQISEKDKQIAELQKLLDQSQKLNAMDKQKILELEDKMAAEHQEQDQKQDSTVEKKKWWKRFI